VFGGYQKCQKEKSFDEAWCVRFAEMRRVWIMDVENRIGGGAEMWK
jgi:hypothetical protein